MYFANSRVVQRETNLLLKRRCYDRINATAFVTELCFFHIQEVQEGIYHLRQKGYEHLLQKWLLPRKTYTHAANRYLAINKLNWSTGYVIHLTKLFEA